MNLLTFDKTILFDQENEDYKDILKYDKHFCKTCRWKINYQKILESLENFTFGYINISRFIPYRHQYKEEVLKLLGNNHYETSSSEDEEDDIDHDKIIINAFVICELKTYKNGNGFSLNIDILCGRLDHKGLGSDLLRLVLQYCIDNEIKYCELEAPYPELVSYYESFGFTFVKRILDSYYMERKNY